MENYFEILNNINVKDKVEKKNGLSYLSWAWAWGEVKKLYPDATYNIYERETEYGAVNYFTDGRTCWVKTGVTINGIEHIEELPVMDYKNKSILYEAVTSFDVNKTIQRSLTKAIARHGLGLYIYAGEDLPENYEYTKEDAENYEITFGKYIGSKLSDIIEDESYIDWIIKSSNDEGILKCIELLTGKKKLSEEEQDMKLSDTQELMDLIIKYDVDLDDVCKGYKVSNLNELSLEQYNKCIQGLKKRYEA